MFITSTISLSSTILQTPTPTPTLNNNLVNSGTQDLVYIGVFLLAISLVSWLLVLSIKKLNTLSFLPPLSLLF